MKRQLKVGDTIKAQGITATIAEITFQEPWEWREAWYLEFTDTNGNYRNWKQNCDGGKAYDENGNEIDDEEQETNNNSNKEDKDMMNNKAQVQVTDFEFDGVRYTNTRPGYYYKKENGKQVRIGKAEWDTAWEVSGEAEKQAREAEQAKKDAEVEKKFNKQKASKPRKSKDIAHETGGVTLTAKQVDFIKHIPDTCFYENGLDSTMWVDILADEIGGQFAGKPMTIGAMVSTLKEKEIIYVAKDRVNGKTSKFFGFTDLGKQIAKELGLN